MKSTIGWNLSRLRKQHKLTQEEVAERIGVSRQTVAKWESGETIPDITNCNELALLYNVSLDALVNYEEFAGLPVPNKGRHLFGTTVVGERGQIVIPANARKVFDIKPGDRLVVLGDEARGIALLKEADLLKLINQNEV